MAIANLNNAPNVLDDGNDSIVIVDNFQSIRGGRTLDVTEFSPTVIRAGHVIIQATTLVNGNIQYKPMPVTGAGAIENFGTVTPGSGLTDGYYPAVALTGGSGSGATANIIVEDGVVVGFIPVANGTAYVAGDVLSAAVSTIGNTGTAFTVPVASVTTAAAYASLPANHTYTGVLINSVLTAKPFAGIMVRGTINPVAAPYDFATIAAALKTANVLIDQRAD